MPDQFPSIDDHFATSGRSLLAGFGAQWLCHAATGGTAAKAGTGGSRSNGSGAGVSLLR